MAFNGSGVFSRLYSWVSDAANAIKISSSRMDAEFDGIATALSSCLLKDGQQVPTANLPMGGFKLTGLGAATASGDAARYSQTQAQPFGGRLTLTTAVPFLSATVTSAATIYYALATGNMVPVYDGTLTIPTVFTELSQALSDTTKSPAAGSANSVYDMFVWSDSGTLRCTRGPKWTSATGRGTGAGTSELTRVLGLLMNANAITNGPAASRGMYVGTVATDTIGRANMKFGGTGAAGGEAIRLDVWNAYNRVLTTAINFDNTDSWTYNSATLQVKNANNNNKIQFVTGMTGLSYRAKAMQAFDSAGTSHYVRISVTLDSTTTPVTGASDHVSTGGLATNGHGSVSAFLIAPAPLGAHFVVPLEASSSASNTFYGDNGGTFHQSIFTFSMEM